MGQGVCGGAGRLRARFLAGGAAKVNRYHTPYPIWIHVHAGETAALTGGYGGQRMCRFLVSGRNSVPITKVMSATMMGYHRP